MTHTCPGPRCDKEVSQDMLACSRHWYQVPRALRTAVWRAWADGAGSGSTAHTLAMARAVKCMTRLPAPK